MPELSPKPSEFRPGRQISMEAVNQLVRGMPRVITGDGVEVKRFGDRWAISNRPNYVYASDLVQYFVVVEEFADYLTCVTFSFSYVPQTYDVALADSLQIQNLTGTVVYVAKPWWLQQSPWINQNVIDNGQIVSFTFPSINQRLYSPEGGDVIEQVIEPSYFVGDIIMAKSGPTGLTYIDEEEQTQPIVWMDTNNGSRRWESDAPGTVTHTGTLTNPYIVIGNGGSDIKVSPVTCDEVTGMLGFPDGSGVDADGGELTMMGGTEEDCVGGFIDADGGDTAGAWGGSIEVYGETLPGGDIATYNGGGHIHTQEGGGGIFTYGTGLIELGVAATRTSFTGNATTARAIGLPDASGTVALTGAITNGQFTMSTARLLGRTTASTGAIEEISIGSGVSLAAGVLTATGLGGTVTSINVSGGTTGLTFSGGPVTTSGTITMAGTLAVANGGTGVTTSTGSGSVVLSTSPVLVTPNLGTPSAGVLTNCTGLPISTGVSGLGAGVAAFLATPSSANLATAVTDETGSGSLVFSGVTTLSSLVSIGTITTGTWNATLIGAQYGGTGANTLTARAVLLGNGTGAVAFATIGTAGRLLIDQGAGSNPAFTVMGTDATITSAGALTIANNAITTAKINNAAVTYAKIQNVTNARLLGNNSGGAAAPSEISLASTLSFPSSTTLGINLATANTWTGVPTVSIALGANTAGDGVVLRNSASATAANQQYSSALRFYGEGWDSAGGATKKLFIRQYLVPVQQAGNPTGTLRWDYSFNTGAYSNLMALSTVGGLRVGDGTEVTANGVVDAVTGFRISGSAASARYLRGNGTNFVSAAISMTDLPTVNSDVGTYAFAKVTANAQGLITAVQESHDRLTLSDGTALSSGDFTLGAGWGASAAVTSVTGVDSRFTIEVTTDAADTPLANPTITLTFADGAWASAPFVVACMDGNSSGPLAAVATSPLTNKVTLTYIGTPTATSARTYIFTCVVIG